MPYLVNVHFEQCFNRLAFQTYIIIIGGIDNGQFRLCINHSALKMFGQGETLLIDTSLMCYGTFTMFVEGAVIAATLTKSHLLYFGHQKLYLIVCELHDFLQQTVSLLVIHANHADECEVVECLGTSVRIGHCKT